MAKGIKKYLEKHAYLHERLKPFTNTIEGESIYKGYLDHVTKVYPQCICELKGLAKGADIDLKDVSRWNSLYCISKSRKAMYAIEKKYSYFIRHEHSLGLRVDKLNTVWA